MCLNEILARFSRVVARQRLHLASQVRKMVLGSLGTLAELVGEKTCTSSTNENKGINCKPNKLSLTKLGRYIEVNEILMILNN